MKVNVVGIIGAIIALIGLALPWWTLTFSLTALTSLSYSASIYLYQTTASGLGTTLINQMNLWYGWAAFALLVLGALLGIAFSLIPRARAALAIAGILTLLSAIVFVLGLQSDLSSNSAMSGIGVFSNGSFSIGIFGYSYATYLSFGFWLAVVGAIVMLFAPLAMKPEKTAPTAVPPPPPAEEKPSTPPA